MNRSRQLLNKHRHDHAADEAPRQQGCIGQVTSLHPEKGYGFLVYAGQQYFFHRDDFVQPADFDQVLAGSYVTFHPRERSPKGPRADQLELA